MTALRREPERRSVSLATLVEDLRRFLDGRPIGAPRGRPGNCVRTWTGCACDARRRPGGHHRRIVFAVRFGGVPASAVMALTPTEAIGSAGPLWLSTPRWYLWDGGFLLTGRAQGVVPPHLHHAIQLVVALEGSFAIRGERGDWRPGRGAIVRPDALHSYDPNGGLNAMLFVDPESSEGIWLRGGLREDITVVPETRLADCAAELRRYLEQPFDSLPILELVRRCVQAFCTSVAPSRALDLRVTRVLTEIRASGDLRISLDEAAATACLSPSRFAHLFRQQVGLPFRRYLLWRKLTRAMLVIGRGCSISTAAHEADFSDAAHLTHTFHRMVGIAPSVLMYGELFEVASPFEV